MDKRDWIIIGLSLQISVLSYVLYEKGTKLSYMEGQQQAFRDLSTENDGTLDKNINTAKLTGRKK